MCKLFLDLPMSDDFLDQPMQVHRLSLRFLPNAAFGT